MSTLFKLVKVFTSQTEAQMARGFLEANGIEVQMHGAKEYSYHITGIDNGRYELKVLETDVPKAMQLLNEPNAHTSEPIAADVISMNRDGHEKKHEAALTSNIKVSPKRLLNYEPPWKSLYLLILSMILIPIVGNFLSIYYIYKTLKSKRTPLIVLSMILMFILNAAWVSFFIYFSLYRQGR